MIDPCVAPVCVVTIIRSDGPLLVVMSAASFIQVYPFEVLLIVTWVGICDLEQVSRSLCGRVCDVE